MAAKLNAYLNFKNQAKEAMEFYQAALGGDLSFTTFKDGGMAEQVQPEEVELIMHGALEADGLTLFGSDSPSHMNFDGHHQGFALSLSGQAEDEAKLREYWTKLTEGAEISMDLAKAPWGDTFGMFTDKFGIGWMVNITQD